MKGSHMYAIITTGGKQYKVAKGDVFDVEKLDVQPGDEVKLDVLMLNEGKKVLVDAATLAKKKVTCKVVDQHKGEKQIVFKFQKRKRHSVKRGHRQNLTRLEVCSMPRITSTAKKAASTEAAAE